MTLLQRASLFRSENEADPTSHHQSPPATGRSRPAGRLPPRWPGHGCFGGRCRTFTDRHGNPQQHPVIPAGDHGGTGYIIRHDAHFPALDYIPRRRSVPDLGDTATLPGGQECGHGRCHRPGRR